MTCAGTLSCSLTPGRDDAYKLRTRALRRTADLEQLRASPLAPPSYQWYWFHAARVFVCTFSSAILWNKRGYVPCPNSAFYSSTAGVKTYHIKRAAPLIFMAQLSRLSPFVEWTQQQTAKERTIINVVYRLELIHTENYRFLRPRAADFCYYLRMVNGVVKRPQSTTIHLSCP